MAAMQIGTMRQESNTVDEPIHLFSGYAYWQQRTFGLNAEHPPLAKMLYALPLLAMHPDLPHNFADSETEEGEPARQFLFHNRVDADRMLTATRSVAVAICLCLGALIAGWTRLRFGAVASLLALTLFCFDPTFLGHGHYVTNDVAAALAYFATCITWTWFLDRPTFTRMVAAGAVLGLAIAVKFSLLLAPVVLIAMYFARWRLKRGTGKFSWRHLLFTFQVISTISFIVMWGAYGFEKRVPITDRFVSMYFNKPMEQLRLDPTVPPPMLDYLDPESANGRVTQWIVRNAPVPAYSMWKGIVRFYAHEYWGHDSYLLGNYSRHGWWYYFPVAFAVKTPVSLLAMLLAAAVLGIRFGEPWAELLLPAGLFFAASMGGSIDIGIRHIAPVYPFLFIAVAVALSRVRAGHLIALVLVPLLVVESLISYPNHLAFFNLLAGGSAAGPRYLIDSNLDWGQDLRRLERQMDQRHIASVCLKYFGSAEPGYYKVNSSELGAYPAPPQCKWAAVSVNELYFADSKIKGLRGCKPEFKAGESIMIYALREGKCE